MPAWNVDEPVTVSFSGDVPWFFVKDASCCKLSNGTAFEECCVSCKLTEVKGTLTNAV